MTLWNKYLYTHIYYYSITIVLHMIYRIQDISFLIMNEMLVANVRLSGTHYMRLGKIIDSEKWLTAKIRIHCRTFGVFLSFCPTIKAMGANIFKMTNVPSSRYQKSDKTIGFCDIDLVGKSYWMSKKVHFFTIFSMTKIEN